MREEKRKREITKKRGRDREGAASGIGDFIKNSCVWELLSESSLPDQGLCCQPSSESAIAAEGQQRGNGRGEDRWRWFTKVAARGEGCRNVGDEDGVAIND